LEKYPVILKAINSGTKLYPENDLYNAPTNPLERELASQLSEYFGNKIFTNLKVGFYFPDISFIDDERDILIDIEIDEPYSESQILTHFIGDPKDIQRDKFFTENGWNVIRFSENQVINNTIEIAKTIELFIKSLRNNSILELDEYVKTFNDKRWSEEDSKYFAKYFIRKYYNHQPISISQEPINIIKEFQNLEHIYRDIVARIRDFDDTTHFIFLPYFISDHYLNIKNGERLIYLDCVVSPLYKIINNRRYQLGPFFTNTPRIELFEKKNIDLFKIITEKKKNNSRVSYIDFSDKVQRVYDFCLCGSMKDYYDKNFKFQGNICIEK
jgi:very-short-patch-repair endonuclease